MEKKKTQISLTLAENESVIRTWCENCDDIQIRPMKLGKTGGTGALLIYVEVAVSCVMLKDSVIGKLLNRLMEVPEADIPGVFSENQLGISDAVEFDTMEAAFASMLAGNAILFVDHYDRAVKIGSKGYPNLGVQKAESEKVLRGSNEGFSDSVKTNTALVRKRLRTTDLKVEEIHFGARSDTVLALVYEKELIYPKFLEEVKQQIAGWEVDGVFDSGMVEQLCEPQWKSPFPRFETTERPDRAAMEILDGRILLLCDNSPVGILFPASFDSFLKVSEDRYHHFLIVSFERLLRYAAVFLALWISGGYLAVTGFHTQVLPTKLLLAFAEARKGVPFPGILEILLMEFAFELIREAGVRMPGPLGGTIGIVGGLIIGDAAVSANLVSPMTVDSERRVRCAVPAAEVRLHFARRMARHFRHGARHVSSRRSSRRAYEFWYSLSDAVCRERTCGLPCAEGFRMAAAAASDAGAAGLYKARSESAAAEKQKSCGAGRKTGKGRVTHVFGK